MTKYPTLAKSVGVSSNINIDDGSDAKVNIKTSKNLFAALNDDAEEDEEGAVRRPKEIRPSAVQKVKGERESVALQREVDKYVEPKRDGKKDKKDDKKEKKDFAEDSGDDSADEAKKKKAKDAKKQSKKEEEDKENKKSPEEEEEEGEQEDVKIEADYEAARKKYEGRKKLPAKDIPFSEMKDKPAQQPQQSSKKKKKGFIDEEDDDSSKKFAYAPW